MSYRYTGSFSIDSRTETSLCTKMVAELTLSPSPSLFCTKQGSILVTKRHFPFSHFFYNYILQKLALIHHYVPYESTHEPHTTAHNKVGVPIFILHLMTNQRQFPKCCLILPKMRQLKNLNICHLVHVPLSQTFKLQSLGSTAPHYLVSDN